MKPIKTEPRTRLIRILKTNNKRALRKPRNQISNQRNAEQNSEQTVDFIEGLAIVILIT